jgi:hypothetical protein
MDEPKRRELMGAGIMKLHVRSNRRRADDVGQYGQLTIQNI